MTTSAWSIITTMWMRRDTSGSDRLSPYYYSGSDNNRRFSLGPRHPPSGCPHSRSRRRRLPPVPSHEPVHPSSGLRTDGGLFHYSKNYYYYYWTSTTTRRRSRPRPRRRSKGWWRRPQSRSSPERSWKRQRRRVWLSHRSRRRRETRPSSWCIPQ